MSQVLKFEYNKGEKQIFPIHPSVSNWLFTEDEEAEALLAHHMAVVAEKNGMSSNDLQHLFPAVLRMLKSNINWSK